MDKLVLKAEKRKTFGRKVKKLREGGVLPANIYGKKIKSQAVKVDLTDFEKVFKESGETGLVELALGNQKRPVLIHNVQLDPVRDIPLHADFMQVDLKEKVTAQVPVELFGESPAEKQGLGTVVQYIDEIEVSALPTDLPEKYELDLSQLTEVNQTIGVKDLPADKGKVEILSDPEQVLVKVEPPREEEEEAPPPVEEEEAKVEEGEEEVKEKVEEEEEKESKEKEKKEP